jgi:hypothetical protein
MSRFGAVSILSLGLVVAAVVAPVSASPGATPNGSAGGSYVALGDSFTAGQGASPWLDETCLRSESSSYPAIAAATSSYREAVNVACSGATTVQIADQIANIDSRTKLKASLVTITVGGIDAGAPAVFAACSSPEVPSSCDAALTAALDSLPAVGGGLAATYTQVAAAFPKARIVVLGYPYLLDPSFPDPLTAGLINGATDALNGTIAFAVATTGDPRVTFTDVTAEFEGHGIGSRKSFISFSGDPADPTNLHPNAWGNAAYVSALRNDGFLRGR